MEPNPNKRCILGAIKHDSPLRGVFENDMAPLIHVGAQMCELGPDPRRSETHACYLLNTKECTPPERERIAQMMHRLGQGTPEEARKQVETLEPIPIREHHIAAISFPLRFVV